MGEAKAIEVQADYFIRGQDLRSYYAGFTRRALPEGALWRLSLASSVLPEEHVGYKFWLTLISGTDRFCPELQDWAIGLGATMARMKPRLKQRSRVYVSSYKHEWGRQASLDGLCMAQGLDLWGGVSLRERAEQFGCDREAYQRVRDFVAGAFTLSAWQYEDALRWAHRVARDS